jgi:hypothetical protein
MAAKSGGKFPEQSSRIHRAVSNLAAKINPFLHNSIFDPLSLDSLGSSDQKVRPRLKFVRRSDGN